MQAVRLARYHTGRSHLVRFCGAYHGWWGDVQPGVGNPVPARETYTLNDMSEATLRVLRTRRDIACVLVNPLQALHPNAGAPADTSLVDSSRSAHFDRDAYADWLQRAARGLHRARHRADLRRDLRRLPARAAAARRNISACRPTRHLRQDARRRLSGRRRVRPQGLHEALPRRPARRHLLRARHVQLAPVRHGGDARVPARASTRRRSARCTTASTRVERARAQRSTRACATPVCRCGSRTCRRSGPCSYTRPSRYNWMFQYYLRAEGLALSWIGTGRLIFSLNYTDADFDAVADRFVAAAKAMQQDGWWWAAPAHDQQVDQPRDPAGDARRSVSSAGAPDRIMPVPRLSGAACCSRHSSSS